MSSGEKMSVPAEPSTRDKERTRRAVLDAAERLLLEQGNRVSLASIAKAAGVSKGGLMHHFPTKELLLLALAQTSVEAFRKTVMDAVDLAENRPGKLLRAYVRILCAQEGAPKEIIGGAASLWLTLSNVEGITELFEEDDALWEKAFARDGLNLTISRIVRYAAERAAETRFDNSDDLRALREKLLALAEPE